jgi:hypothetical protein
MSVRRVVVSGLSVVIVALALSACAPNPTVPYLPWPLAVSSPYHSASTAFIDAISGIGRQQAKVRVCSLAGGPLAVDVRSPGADAGTQLTVRAVSTDLETTGDVVDATLIEETYPRGTVTVDTHFESSRALRSGECADVTLVGTHNRFSPGDPFYFTVTW